MFAADVTLGTELEPVVDRLLGEPGTSYLHVHNAKPECYSCRVDRL